MTRIVRVPDQSRSAHGVFTADPAIGTADFPAPAHTLLRRFGATPDELARLEARPFVRVFLTERPPTDALAAAEEARRDALALAAEHDGVVIDLTLPRIVHGPVSTAAHQWVGVDVDADGLTTRGLEAVGLPELRIDEVTPDATAATIALMLGLSQRLLTEWPANDPVGPATVTLQDIAQAYDDVGEQSAESDRACDLLIALKDNALVITVLGDPTTDLFGT